MYFTVNIPGLFGDYLATSGFNADNYCTLTRTVRYGIHQFEAKIPADSTARFCDDLDVHIKQCVADVKGGLASHRQSAGARMMRKRVTALRAQFAVKAGAADG